MRQVQRVAVGVLVAIMLAGTMQAQDMWQTIVNSRFFDAGTFTSPSVSTPAEITTGARVRMRVNMQEADALDPALTLRIAIEGSFDASGLTWTPLASAVWTGGMIRPDTGLPATPLVGWQAAQVPLFVRVVLDTPRRVRLGADVEIVQATEGQ